jgi:hypothetical protein
VTQPGVPKPKLGLFKSSSSADEPEIFCRLSGNLRISTVAQQLPSDGTGSWMDFIAGLVVGFVIGFMLALFLFSWLTAMSESEDEP